ncbi:inner membrane protein YpjD [Dyella monticola]|uniref:Inner membrane protein YpjD n=1 Tax=Dyella monticola TaxID=1927958 RepID=A0A370X962_9GAMM|nr:cytochrome c biogenesis protein CcsA [Dyella monticola]RDS84810.1 inner membrane protein YpjD [Dyella monticola]
MLAALAIFAIACYLLASGLLAQPLFSGPSITPAKWTRPALVIASIAVIVHAAWLLAAHRGALDLHFFAALSLVACVVSALTLVVNLTRPVAALGVIVFPLSAVLLLVDSFFAPPTIPMPMDWHIKLHVTVALLAFSVLSIAAAMAILLAIQEQALRHRQISPWLSALPPLTLTESLLFRLIGAGFALLTVALLTGILFVNNLFGQHLVHKTVLSIIAWLVFGALLYGRWKHGWRGRSAVNLTLIGMATLLLAFFGSKFVLEVVLHRAVD